MTIYEIGQLAFMRKSFSLVDFAKDLILQVSIIFLNYCYVAAIMMRRKSNPFEINSIFLETENYFWYKTCLICSKQGRLFIMEDRSPKETLSIL